jgi:hypothetical protein
MLAENAISNCIMTVFVMLPDSRLANRNIDAWCIHPRLPQAEPLDFQAFA